MKPLSPEYTQQIIQKIQTLPADASPDVIAKTTDRLRSMNYQPILLNDAPDFLQMTRNSLIQFICDLTSKPEARLSEQNLSLLVYHFSLLQRLRRDEPEAWDVITELMEDD